MMGYYLIAGIMFLVGMYVSNRLKSKFETYSHDPLMSGMSGKEVAEQMLRDNGIMDVKVISTPGRLTDHYNPADKTVNLSESVYASNSIAAAAVAAHECGHAVQHATGYSMLQLRSKLVPVVNISTRLSQWVIMIGLALLVAKASPIVMLVGIVLFAMSTIFSLVTLPVEYDASNRALKWLESAGVTVGADHDKAQDALKWAARTYVVAAISSIATLIYYIMLFTNSRSRD
ncbi:zinc metallopeptidase [Edaphocola aurantiacus]|uniref:zinc metallopeptidase n=1 Tax=Edaphocola aurantiacus TaxID=2601682 RepID=UPI001C970007|nr:zinc metallopeptidase [Edaphocola aurantiacus]